MEVLLALDRGLFQAINYLAGRWTSLDGLGAFLAQGSQFFMAALFLVGLYLIYRRHPRRPLPLLFLAVALVAIPIMLSDTLRELIMRPRPFVEMDVNALVEQAPRPSLPSNHSAGSFAVAGMYQAFLPSHARYIIILSTMVALSRVFIGTHFPLDVLTGAALGFLPGFALSRYTRGKSPWRRPR